MSAYVALNLLVLSVVLLVLLALTWWMRRTGRPPLRWRALAAAAAVLLLVSAVFDNLMIGVGLFDYDPSTLSGWMIGRIPVEDFAYPVAAALLMPVLWHAFESKPESKAGEQG